MKRTLANVLPPAVIAVLVLAAWEAVVRLRHTPEYLLPSPLRIAAALRDDWPMLYPSLLQTLAITGEALLAAALLGAGLAVLLIQAKWIERSLFPFAVILQVTPLVAIAPLLLIWIKDVRFALVLCAFLVAFFPVAANTTLGLQSADHHLLDLMRLYGSSRWKVLRFVRLPSALPYFLGGLRISGGLSLIGAVVAEFVAGTGGAASGLAYRILEAGYTLQIPRMFAALALLAGSGVLLYALLSGLSHLLLRRWHESAVRRENRQT
ncbi:MAG TPA: ABC transporter permease [Thermoanaerobaculia bacterium]|jgi:NitT/TauT family transport system permease protein|nr:ABC transporter permease [Thermoanaerobaculia bacterium]